MHTIWKFPVRTSDVFTIDLPVGARFLDVQTQNGIPQCWFLLDPSAPKRSRRFALIGTGHEIKDDVRELTHRGTFQLHGGALVFHLFECDAPEY